MEITRRDFLKYSGASFASLSLTGCVTTIRDSKHLGNFHVVEEGKFYRSGQLSPRYLKSKVEKHGINTVINLRGEDPREWYSREKEICEELGVEHLDRRLNRNPIGTFRERFLAYLDSLENSEYPILIHCSAGKDRAGIGTTAYRIQKMNYTTEEAINASFGKEFNVSKARNFLIPYKEVEDALSLQEWVKQTDISKWTGIDVGI